LRFVGRIKLGEWRNDFQELIKIKKHGRPAVSLFRYGLDYIIEAIAKTHRQSHYSKTV
jgi:hypothetical protein